MAILMWALVLFQAGLIASTFMWDAPIWLRVFVGCMFVINLVQAVTYGGNR